MCTYFKTKPDVAKHLIKELLLSEDLSIGRILSQKKKWRCGLISKKTEILFAELNEREEADTSSYSASGDFLQYIYSVLVAKNHQKIESRCLLHKFSFTDIF